MFSRAVPAFALLGILAAAPACAASGRFLYVIGCDAQLSKIDTLGKRQTENVDLASRTGADHRIPEARGVLDGCLSYQAVYDQATSSFYTVVPQQAESKADGTKDYVVLGFSVPDLKLASEMKAGVSRPDPPHIEMNPAGHLTVVSASEWSPPSTIDLQGFRTEGKPDRNQILETSGDQILLRLFPAHGEGLTIGVADLKSRTLAVLQHLPATTARNVHLAPGGQAVLVEEIAPESAPVKTTGRLFLFDASSGRTMSSVDEPAIRGMAFLAVSPNGRAIYYGREDYRLVGLDHQFSDDLVTRSAGGDLPGTFFADR